MRSSILRGALVANALFSLASGLLFVLGSGTVATWLGNVPPWMVAAVGSGLVAFAVFLIWEARQVTLRAAQALWITLADVGWVLGSIVLLLLPGVPLSVTGRWMVGLVAVVVLGFAILQIIGLRALTRNRRGTTAARSAFEIRQRVAAPPEAMWAIVRDLRRIGTYYPVLQRVEVVGQQHGARRTCENREGQRWSEEVMAWDEQARAFTLRFDVDAPDFPFPTRELYGGWHVEETSGTTYVVLWYEFTMRGGVFGEILAPLMAQRIRQSMLATIARMEDAAQRLAEQQAAASQI